LFFVIQLVHRSHRNEKHQPELHIQQDAD